MFSWGFAIQPFNDYLVSHLLGASLVAHAAVNKADDALPSWSSYFNKYFGCRQRENTQRNKNQEHLAYNLRDVFSMVISWLANISSPQTDANFELYLGGCP